MTAVSDSRTAIQPVLFLQHLASREGARQWWAAPRTSPTNSNNGSLSAPATDSSPRRPTFPGAFEDFVRLVDPELQRRGLYHREYEGLTLRENLGLGRPQPGWWKESAGKFCAVSLPVSAKGRQRIAHQRAALLPAAGNQTGPGEFFLRSFDGNARASGEAESPDPRRSQDPRDKHP
jgi:hypothetical protein